MGLSSIGSNYFWHSPHNSQFGIGLGFVAIFVIDLINNGKSHWWPLIPGGIMVFTALGQGAFGLRNLFHMAWPVILIVLGLWIIAKSTGIVKEKENETEVFEDKGNE